MCVVCDSLHWTPEELEEHRIFEEELAEQSQRAIDSMLQSGFIYKEERE